MGIFWCPERVFFVAGLGAIELAGIRPAFDHVPKGIAGEDHEIAATSYESLKLLAFVATRVFAMTDAQMRSIVIQDLGLCIVVGVYAVIYRVLLCIQPRGEELIPGIITAHKIRL